MKTFTPPTVRSLSLSSASLRSPMGKLGLVGTPTGGDFTRSDAIRNSRLQRRIDERKDELMLFKAKLRKESAPVTHTLNGKPVLKVTRISASHVRANGKLEKGFHLTGVGRVVGDINAAMQAARKAGYSHVRTGAVTKYIGSEA